MTDISHMKLFYINFYQDYNKITEIGVRRNLRQVELGDKILPIDFKNKGKLTDGPPTVRYRIKKEHGECLLTL